MKVRVLNGNFIKIVAAIAMLIDHIGLLFFPDVVSFRVIGRISMPLFAMMFAEGCRYTRSKFRHVFLVAVLGIAYSIVFYLFSQELYFSILTMFTFSALMIYAYQAFQKSVFEEKDVSLSVCTAAIFIGLVAFTYLFCMRFNVDYGFWGCMLPVFPLLFDLKEVGKGWWTDNYYVRLGCFAIALLIHCLASPWTISYFAFLSFIPLLLYNGRRGKLKLKSFFYVFYPSHLVVLYGILMLISYNG